MESKKIKNLLVEYLTQVTEEVKRIASGGKGREILGEVINRPEDIEIGIDRVGEKILEKLVKKYELKATIFSEPDGRDIKTNGENPEIYGSIDPFDGSVLYLRGFQHNWYSVLSFFDKKKNPICCGVSDILNEKFYLSDEEGNYVLDLKTGRKNKIMPSKNKSLKKPIVLASYIMSSQYSTKFLDIFGDLLKEMHSKALLYPQGGSFIYAFLAAGLVDAYVMFDEPRSEIDPGFSIAKKAGCPVVTIDTDGSYKDYEFLPGRQHDKVDLLIAAANAKIRDELIKYYLKKYGEKFSFKS
ncbi:MAG TPA: inositol monophosphatase family protein [Patescibacteria group bacterium]|nr:inositol monophosphatase family protein [Patescibacteria group bacterium]